MSARYGEGYATFVDWIVGMTARIWEGRGIGLIHEMYAPDVIMHTGFGTSRGIAGVVAGTFETLHSFPDRRLLPEDVIWSESGANDAYSSHRIASSMTHRGEGSFGPPSGRAALVRTIADCLVRDGRVVEEWLVRDQAGLAIQLGLDPRELGARLAAAMPVQDAPPPATTCEIPHGSLAARAAAMQGTIWNEDRLDAMDRFVVGYRAAFPDARLHVGHAITLEEPGRPARVALRWRLDGTHSGRGGFGPPTGAPVAILGITHSEIVEGRVAREFVLVDELGIWTALARARG